jgi:phytanoyl-CoA hydroxylase
MSNVPWFMSVDAAEQIRKREATVEVKTKATQLVDQGYCVIEDAIETHVCDRLVERFRRIEGAHPDKFGDYKDQFGHYPRIVNFHLAMPELLTLFSENVRTLAVTDFLFDAETVLYTSLFYERGSSQDIHRDTPYFATRPEYRYLGVWTALEDVDETNGPLCVVPGGHLLPELDREELVARHYPSSEDVPSDSPQLWQDYQRSVFARCTNLGLTVKTVPVRKGSTIIWHPQLPHGGAPIVDISRTRFSLVMHVTPENSAVYHHQVFFNPRRPFPSNAPWKYSLDSGRKFAMHSAVSFAHQRSFLPSEFAIHD